MAGFLFGAGTGLTYDQLQDRRRRTDLLAKRLMGQQPRTTMEGVGALLQGAAVGLDNWQTDKQLGKYYDERDRIRDQLYSSLTGGHSFGQPVFRSETATAPQGLASTPPNYSGTAMPKVEPNGNIKPTSSTPDIDVSQNGSTYEPFINTVKAGGLTNPFGLSAVAATGRAESGWSPKKAGGAWSDPSESGQAGTSGGVMSWRAERLANLRRYAASKGEEGNGSPQTQAEFFMQEDPSLIAKLQGSKSADEAAGHMANAWRFAGYNRSGGESSRRQSYANSYLPRFQGTGDQVASFDPTIGMSGSDAIDAIAPPSGQPLSGNRAPYRDPRVSAPNFNPNATGAPALPYAAPDPQNQPPMTSGGLRPFEPGERRDNEDGSYSTEVTTTWQLPDGAWANVPSLWMSERGPKQFDPNDEDGIMSTMQEYENLTGKPFPRFGSQQEAEAAARARSVQGGADAAIAADTPPSSSTAAQDREIDAFHSSMKGGQMPQRQMIGQSPLGDQPMAAFGSTAPGTQLPPLPSRDVGPAPLMAGPQGGQTSAPGVVSSPFVPPPMQPPPQAPQQVAQNGQGYYPPRPQTPSEGPGALNPAVIEMLKNPAATEQDRAMALYMLEQWQDGNDPGKRLDLQLKEAQIAAARAKAANGDAPEFFGTTVPYYDANGNLRYRQLGKNGVGKDVDFGEGASAAPPTRTIDNGVELITVGPGGQEISRVRKDLSGVERDKATGKAQGDAEAALPQVENAAGELLGSIDSLAKDPYLDSMVGSIQGKWLPNVTSDANRVQSKMNQIGGQSFMQAFNSLRGAGQITEQEGKKATEAMARLNTAQDEKDYRDALNELRGVVQRSLDTARRKASGPISPTAPGGDGRGTGGNSGRTGGGVGWSVEN